MLDIKPKLSSLVSGQLPEFIRADYQTFVAFLEAYYEFLENNVNSDYKTLKDLDNTLDSFLQYFKHEIAINLPNTQVDERFLLQHIRELYRAKGTEASFKLLFRILFKKDVVVDYPYSRVMIPSDGKWVQDKSIFVRVSKGNPELITGRKVQVVTPSQTFDIVIKSYKAIDPLISSDTSIYELFYEKDYYNVISAHNKVFYDDEFVADILYTTTKINVFGAGAGFKPGQVYPINSGSGIGSAIKIKTVTTTGGIKTAEFISFGVGYESNFYAYITSDQAKKISFTQLPFTISSSGTDPKAWDATIRDNTQEFIDFGIITKPNYNKDTATPALGALYVGDVVRSFNNTTTYSDNTVNADDIAILYIEIGAEAKYTGYFKSNDGFLSDAIYLQDSKYYQKFAYVLKIDEQLSKYESFVKTLIHPTGNALFGEYSIINEFNLSETLQSMVKFSNLVLDDKVTMSDSHWLHFMLALTAKQGLPTRPTYINNDWVNRPDGTNGVKFNIPLIGMQLLGNVGRFVPWFIIQADRTGKQLNTAISNVGVRFDLTTQNFQIDSNVGQLGKKFDINTPGNRSNFSISQLDKEISIKNTGVSASSNIGILGTLCEIGVGLSGFSTTLSGGQTVGGQTLGLSGLYLPTGFGNENTYMIGTQELVGLSLTSQAGSVNPSMSIAKQILSNSAITSIGNLSTYSIVGLSGLSVSTGFGTYSDIINTTLIDSITPADSGYVVYNAYIFGPDLYIDSTYFEGTTSF
jgi:hypothetical protein